jgi:hypothetical protein
MEQVRSAIRAFVEFGTVSMGNVDRIGTIPRRTSSVACFINPFVSKRKFVINNYKNLPTSAENAAHASSTTRSE